MMPSSLKLAFALSLFVGCTAAAIPLAPAPPDTSKQYFFPTRVGTKMTYDDNLDRDGGYGKVITDSVEKNGRYTITVKSTGLDWKDSDSTTIDQYLVSKDGVFLVAASIESAESKRVFDPPCCVLKLPHKVGEKWYPQPDSEIASVTGKVESVKVPAGTFEAIRVDRGPKSMSWYAPRVGLVKSRINDKVIQLRSFALPKD